MTTAAVFAALLAFAPPSPAAVPASPAAVTPADLADAARLLDRAGLPNPRGGQYREVTVSVADPNWYYQRGGERRALTTHAWVLPAKEGEKAPVAVCWNGLAYPAETIGAPADLTADVERWLSPPAAGNRHRLWYGAGGTIRVDAGAPPLLIPMLLRAGAPALARRAAVADPAAVLSLAWCRGALLARCGRALAAYYRGGEDAFAAAEMRAVAAGADVLADEAARAGRLVDVEVPSPLRQARMIAAEAERRAANPAAPMPPADERARLPRARRIALLIAALEDEEGVLQGGPASRALLAEGEAAVLALLDCGASDARLTRAPALSLAAMVGAPVLPEPVPVRSIALGIAEQLLNLPQRSLLAPDRRIARLRAYWGLHRDAATPTERWRCILADDDASPEDWAAAATSLAQAGRRAVREAKKPTVSDLVRWRIAVLTGLDADAAGLEAAGTLCLSLARWEGATSLPTLRDLSDRLRDRLARTPPKDPRAVAMAHARAQAFEARRMADDPLVQG
jgi:hypothetical protein